ncbi:MAG TPA: septum formation protein Maf, partial [Leucothrix sp.]|nr:septum formation protein Maf [Leucothrix sp.]
MTDIILASASPRRAELLSQIGISYQIQAVDIDESSLPNETPEALVQRLAREKSCAVKNAQIPVLGSDTLGVLDGELL